MPVDSHKKNTYEVWGQPYERFVWNCSETVQPIRGYSQWIMTKSQFPHSAFARGPRSPALEEGMRAAMGATHECCVGPYA